MGPYMIRLSRSFEGEETQNLNLTKARERKEGHDVSKVSLATSYFLVY